MVLQSAEESPRKSKFLAMTKLHSQLNAKEGAHRFSTPTAYTLRASAVQLYQSCSAAALRMIKYSLLLCLRLSMYLLLWQRPTFADVWSSSIAPDSDEHTHFSMLEFLAFSIYRDFLPPNEAANEENRDTTETAFCTILINQEIFKNVRSLAFFVFN